MGKTTLVVGLAAGYVLGTKDGRERYEQIKTQASRLWQNPKVQEQAGKAQDLAKQKAPQVQEKVAQAAKKATSKTSAKVGRSSKSSDTTSANGPVTTAAPTTAAPTTAAPTIPSSPPVTPATTTLNTEVGGGVHG